MMKITVALLCIASVQALTTATRQLTTGPGAGADACGDIKCAIIECPPPFKVMTPDDMGTCCPFCQSDIKVPEDRPTGLSGGIGMNNNADPILCRGVVCLPLDCPEFDQEFDASSRCCTHCKKGYKPAL